MRVRVRVSVRVRARSNRQYAPVRVGVYYLLRCVIKDLGYKLLSVIELSRLRVIGWASGLKKHFGNGVVGRVL